MRNIHAKSIEAESVHVLILLVVQGTPLIEAYSCNVWVTETLDRMEDSKAMSEIDWIIAQNRDPVIREIKYLMNKKRTHREEEILMVCAKYKTIFEAVEPLGAMGVLHRWVTPSKKD